MHEIATACELHLGKEQVALGIGRQVQGAIRTEGAQCNISSWEKPFVG